MVEPTLVTADSRWAASSFDIVLLLQYANNVLVECEIWTAFLFTRFQIFQSTFAHTSIAWYAHGNDGIWSSCTISIFHGHKEVGTRAWSRTWRLGCMVVSTILTTRNTGIRRIKRVCAADVIIWVDQTLGKDEIKPKWMFLITFYINMTNMHIMPNI